MSLSRKVLNSVRMKPKQRSLRMTVTPDAEEAESWEVEEIQVAPAMMMTTATAFRVCVRYGRRSHSQYALVPDTGLPACFGITQHLFLGSRDEDERNGKWYYLWDRAYTSWDFFFDSWTLGVYGGACVGVGLNRFV